MASDAYWVSPSGLIINIEAHPIKTIVDNPGLFGLTEEKMIYIYRKYNDVNEWEGEASSMIIAGLIEKGWIYSYKRSEKPGKWIVRVYKLDKKTRFNLQSWANHMISNELAVLSEALKIYRSFKDVTDKKDFLKIIEGDFFN